MLGSEAVEEAGSMEGPVNCSPWPCYLAHAEGAPSCGSPPMGIPKLLPFSLSVSEPSFLGLCFHRLSQGGTHYFLRGSFKCCINWERDDAPSSGATIHF